MLITPTLAASMALNCWATASTRYHLPTELLYAIAHAESGFRTSVVAHNPDGSRDIGVMQINSAWLPQLRIHGITEEKLVRDPCVNIQVGAWILAQEVRRFGYTWHAIGAYNAGPLKPGMSIEKRVRKIAIYREYSARVLGRWKALVTKKAATSAPWHARPSAVASSNALR